MRKFFVVFFKSGNLKKYHWQRLNIKGKNKMHLNKTKRAVTNDNFIILFDTLLFGF